MNRLGHHLVTRHHQATDSIIQCKGVEFGGKQLTVIAGPCAVENYDQMMTIGAAVKASGARMLRGGAFKPRTSPYAFQGLGEAGLEILQAVGKNLQMPVITELMDSDDFELIERYTDVIQIGARNMQNFSLLKRVGQSDKPIMLKRGMSATVTEFLAAAEYIMAHGNSQVILCERGIRTFETAMRNTIDLNVVTAIKQLSHLPIIIDPSHATGDWRMVTPLSRAAVAIGAHGLMIEVHHDPDRALSDGPQSLKPSKFDHLMTQVNALHELITCESGGDAVGW